MDQRTLVERARHGDREAFATLVRASATRLDAAARLILRDRELARDAVQEALIRAWRDLPGLRDPERFDAWLHRLLARAAIDEVRRRRRRVIEVAVSSFEVPAAPDMTTHLADRDALDRALAALTPEQRALVVLHHYLGMPIPESAAVMEITLGAAKARLHRSLGSLRRMVADDRAESPVRAAGGPA